MSSDSIATAVGTANAAAFRRQHEDDAGDSIEHVVFRAVHVPLHRPVAFATRRVTGREYLIAEVRTRDGRRGLGHAYAGTTGGRALRLFAEEVLGPVLMGSPASLIEQIWDRSYQESLLLGRRGLALRAISAVDIALWDLLGIRAGLPLYRLLGGSRAQTPAYASGGYYREGDPLENVTRELSAYLDRGFSDCKIKVGQDFTTDVDRVRVARELLGPHRRLALDANNAWHDAASAIRFGRAVAEYDPWWLEEPLSPDDVGGHSEIARALEFPVAAGELLATRWEFAAYIAQRSADILQPDASVLGGITEWLKVADAAAAAGVPVAPHWDHSVHVHLVAARSAAFTVEYFYLDEDVYNFDELITEGTRLRPASGVLEAPGRPGIGIEFDQKALERFTIA